MAFEVHVERIGDVTVLEMSGRVTLGEGSRMYRDAVREAVFNGARKLAVDYSKIEYQDSSGNGELISAFTTTANVGGEMVLFGLTRRLINMFQITKLYTVFNIFDSLESALAYFDSGRQNELQITESQYFNVAALHLAGSLTLRLGAALILEATDKAIASGADSVILVCDQLLEIDSYGARTLKQAEHKVSQHGGKLVLACAEGRLLSSFAELGVTPAIPISDSLDSALAIFHLKVDRSSYRVQAVNAN